VLIVLCHPSPRSFNAQPAEVARATLVRRGADVEVSDLFSGLAVASRWQLPCCTASTDLVAQTW